MSLLSKPKTKIVQSPTAEDIRLGTQSLWVGFSTSSMRMETRLGDSLGDNPPILMRSRSPHFTILIEHHYDET